MQAAQLLLAGLTAKAAGRKESTSQTYKWGTLAFAWINCLEEQLTYVSGLRQLIQANAKVVHSTMWWRAVGARVAQGVVDFECR